MEYLLFELLPILLLSLEPPLSPLLELVCVVEDHFIMRFSHSLLRLLQPSKDLLLIANSLLVQPLELPLHSSCLAIGDDVFHVNIILGAHNESLEPVLDQRIGVGLRELLLYAFDVESLFPLLSLLFGPRGRFNFESRLFFH